MGRVSSPTVSESVPTRASLSVSKVPYVLSMRTNTLRIEPPEGTPSHATAMWLLDIKQACARSHWVDRSVLTLVLGTTTLPVLP